MVLLRHATPARNLDSILRYGLLTRFSKGKLPVVWCCVASLSSWAVLHCIKRHHCCAETTVVLPIDVPRHWLRHSSRKGIWYCVKDIPPARIERAMKFAELAGISAEE